MQKPNFFLIGTPKAGTTSLYHYLKEHPQIYMSPVKEPRFFDSSNKNWSKYLTLYKNVRHELAIGEASPQYLFSHVAPYNIKNRIPNAKLIVILRQPVDRAYSHFTGYRRRGLELQNDFEQAFHEGEIKYLKREKFGWQYKLLGFYTPQLENYLEYFDSSNIKVCLFDDLVDNPGLLMHNLYKFLSVDPEFKPDLDRKYNVIKHARYPLARQLLTKTGRILIPRAWQAGLNSRFRVFSHSHPSGLDPDIRCRLNEVYRDDIQKLQLLINRDLSHWLSD